MYEDIWEKLYCEARKVQKERVISPFIEAGGVAAALLLEFVLIRQVHWECVLKEMRLLI